MSQENGAVIGINLGNTYGSIACINQHGRADVIANENGERQIATRIAFNGDQVYLGNEATPQLVRNASNVIDNFVTLVGRTYAELEETEKKRVSAQVIDVDGTPSFRVDINGTETVLSAHDVLVRYITALNGAAADFLSGTPITGAVLSVPQWYSDKQIAGVHAAATEAGLHVLQIIPVSISPLVAYALTSPGPLGEAPELDEAAEPFPGDKVLDRTVAVVDMGGTSFDVTIVAARAGVYSVLAYEHNKTIGGRAIDDALVAHFAKEFTKKTKVTIADTDARAWAKLRNESEVTKRALSASNTAHCSVESLAEGIDFSSSINRMRLNILVGGIYSEAQATFVRALEAAKLDASQIDEVILAGGSARLAGLAEQLSFLFAEDATRITESIDSDQVIARGNALYAQTIINTPADAEERRFVESLPLARSETDAKLQVPATKRPIGILFDAPEDDKRAVDGRLFISVVPEFTPVPARRVVRVPLASESSVVRIAEGTPSVRVDKIDPPPADEDEEDEDDEPLEPEEVRTAYVRGDAPIAELVVPSNGAESATLSFVVDAEGRVTVEATVADKVVASVVIGA
ncbi:Hsp70 protein that interacts with Zuo1p [Malassezia cuniculi]|uniref:Hsp70 protein that interacts with Zuo1p n=1 Tax=Malassezia cuniculi TaxID=948313 RepID=A0AAF0J5V1_9BASI|nr:Hsp70 protein that interacts with Zuo1p [Malassezia cuniculi]